MQINRCSKCMQKIESYPCPHCGYTMEGQTELNYALPPNSILYGRYLVGKMLGQGGFGMTYVGWDLVLDQKVAIKEYYPSGLVTRHPGMGTRLLWNTGTQAADFHSSGMENFLKEARKMMKLDNIPAAVRVLNTFFENDTAYIVMEFVDGETLASRLQKNGVYDWKQAKEIFLPLIEGMEQVHRAGLIHRDISPDNIMLQADGKVRILDLGAAKDMTINTGASSMLVAKPGFSPIEQYTQRGTSSPAADVYAMAATMYYTLTGTVPVPSTDRVNADTLRWDLPQLKALPKNVVTALQNAMEISAKNRTPSMAILLKELTGRASRRVKPEKKKSAPIGWIAAILVLVIGAGAGGYFWMTNRLNPPAAPEAAAQAELTEPETAPEITEAETVEVTEEAAEPETEPAETLPEDPRPVLTMRASDNLSKISYNAYSGYSIWGWENHRRGEVQKIVFQDNMDGAPESIWQRYDVSQAKDNSILIWLDGSTLYVGAYGRIAPNANASYLFAGFSNVREIEFGDVMYTGDVTNMSYMFTNCNQLTELDLQFMDTSKVTNMSRTFAECTRLKKLNLDSFRTPSLTNASQMFMNCSSLMQLDLSRFTTSRVSNFTEMFYNCSGLHQLNVSNFTLENTTTLIGMFQGCASLTKLDLSSFVPDRVTSMQNLFNGCRSLSELIIPVFNTYKVTNMQYMFYGCPSLTNPDFSAMDFSNVTEYDSFMNATQTINGRSWKALFWQEQGW